MVRRIANFFFSMQLMAVLLIFYAFSIAIATFIENDFGTTAAKATVYSAFWFELLMVLLLINFIGNIFRYKLYLRKKLTIFLFHLAFAIILFGAFVTRYFGEEGYMHIREGAKSNLVLSMETYLDIQAKSSEEKVSSTDVVLFSPLTANSFSKRLNVDGKDIEIQTIKFVPNANYHLIQTPGGKPVIEIIIPGMNGPQKVYLEEGGTAYVGNYIVGFESGNLKTDISIQSNQHSLILSSEKDLKITNSNTWTDSLLSVGVEHVFYSQVLYKIGEQVFVLNHYEPAGKLVLVPVEDKDAPEGPGALKLLVEVEDRVDSVVVWGSSSSPGKDISLSLVDVDFQFTYGSKYREVPFTLGLKDFILDRYPGSNSPSSFKSIVLLEDKEKGISEERQIFMNNVLNHRGYKFFQSSYDTDERGTILSVNRDLPGTIITYLGYLMLAVGFFSSLINKNSRFQVLRKTTSMVSIIAFLLLVVPSTLNASENDGVAELANNTISKEHAAEFGELLIQDNQGRIKPVNTLASQVLRKISRKTSINGLNADQVLLGMLSNPQYWQQVPLIKASHPSIKELLGIETNYISFRDITFSNRTQTYILGPYVEEAYRKKPAYRNKFDNEIIRLDERVNIAWVIYTNSLLKVFPKPNDPSNTWFSPSDSLAIHQGNDTILTTHIISLYYHELSKAIESGDYSETNEYLESIKAFQLKFGGEVIPTPKRQSLELWYNKANIFDRISNYYALFGIVLLILNLIGILNEKLKLRIPNIIGFWIILLIFIAHAVGLGIRWYVSGHAPWSNGYEALIYISWATVLAGFLFSRNAPVAIPLTAVLAYLILHVAHLSWMDPEITNLVPVLKSVWLVIHVAIITASYGFLALGALLALFNLILMIFKTNNNHNRLDGHIYKLSNILEMTLIAGLYMLAIGTFLGGVWANESWGRYWGWDPKEAWALITVVVYAFIAHMRLIPGLRGVYAFNLLSLFGFWSVIMTYFGVNFYLAGLHSYAKGDPLPVPKFVLFTVVSLVIIAIVAFVNNYYINKKNMKLL